MERRVSIVLGEETLDYIKEKRGLLNRSEYIEECLLNYWEKKSVFGKYKKKKR